MAAPESANGILLRTYPLTETSLIVRWLTEEHGRISTVAKGARRDKSAFKGKLDLFFQCTFTFRRSPRSDLHQLGEVRLEKTRIPIRMNYLKLKQAAYWVTLLEMTTEVETPLEYLYDLGLEFLDALLENEPVPGNLLALELKWLSALGWEPNLQSGPKISSELEERIHTLLTSDWDSVMKLEWSASTYSQLRGFLTRYWREGPGFLPKRRDTEVPPILKP